MVYDPPVRLCLAVVSFAALLGAGWTYASLPGNREFAVFDTNPPTPYFHYSPKETSRGRILVVHGLDASKHAMNILSYALADAGFEVFAMDLPGHGDSSARFTVFDARDAVVQVLNRLRPDTSVIGHSLGGALLLDIAGDRHIPRMVLFSPAPTPLDPILSDRILVLEGQFDPGHIRAFATPIRAAATGSMEYRDMAWTGHSGGVFRPWILHVVADWLGGSNNSRHTTQRLFLFALMMGSGLMFGVLLMGFLPAQSLKVDAIPSAPVSILGYVVAAVIAAIVLSFVDIAAWLRLYATSYLVGIMFLTGLALLWRFPPPLTSSVRNLSIALAGATCMIVLLYFTVGEVAHVSLSGDRWWRFPAITALSLPLFLADETLLGSRNSRWQRTVTAVVTRLLLGAITVTGALTLNREAAFLLLLMPAIVLFWIFLWLSGRVVRRRTDAFGTALFAALVQAWIFAALFVTT